MTDNRHAVVLLAAAFLAGCASEVVRTPVTIEVDVAQTTQMLIDKDVDITLDGGYHRTLRSGTTLTRVGKIDQGAIFKPSNTVFTVEGRHVHEAYIVLHKGALVGFYLPVEKAYSPLSRTINIGQ